MVNKLKAGVCALLSVLMLASCGSHDDAYDIYLLSV